MARKATGQVIERKRKGRRRVFALRFRAYGQRHYLTLPDGTTREQAEDELKNVLADVRRGIWRPLEPEPEVEEPKREPTFHEFASEWFEAKKHELEDGTVVAYEWQLTHHLLPYFARHRLSQITVEEVDRYRGAKVRERDAIIAAVADKKPLMESYVDKHGKTRKRRRRPLSDETINKTIGRLGQILEVADEYGYIGRNPARGRRRRLKVSRPRARFLDRAEQITALMDAAGELDREARADRGRYRKPVIAALVFTGARISEVLALRWRDVDQKAERLWIVDSKTAAGVREIPLPKPLLRELAVHQEWSRFGEPDDLVFCTRNGKRLGKDNVRERVVYKAIAQADQALVQAGYSPLPQGLTPHSLRHTYISLRMALRHDPVEVSEDAGHSDLAVTHRIYTHALRLGDAHRERLRALWNGAEWAPLGTSGDSEEQAEPAEAQDSAL